MPRYADLPAGSDHNTPLDDREFTRLAAQATAVNRRRYVSPIAYLARRRNIQTGGTR